jgi:RHS repeat-associated protein
LKSRRAGLRLLALQTALGMTLQLVPFAHQDVAAARFRPPSAQVKALSIRKQELTERRTPNSRTFQMEDGTRTVEVFAKPIHYRAEDGKLYPIDNSLVVDASTGEVHNQANRYKALFQKDLGADFLRLEFGGRTISFALEGTRAGRSKWLGNQIAYEGALPNVDLRYQTGADYLKEEIWLKGLNVPPTIAFRMGVEGARIENRPEGGLTVRDKKSGNVLWSLPPFFMRDAGGQVSAGVEVSLKESGNQVILSLTPNRAWLEAADRVYPVMIDPTLVLGPSSGSGHDTTIFNGNSTQTLSAGVDSVLFAGSQQTALLQFDLSGIPRNAVIDGADLNLYNLTYMPTSNTTGLPNPTVAPQLGLSPYTGGLQGGSYNVTYTYVTPRGESVAAPPATITTQAQEAITVQLPVLPTGATGFKVYASRDAQPRYQTSTGLRQVTLVTEPGATGPTPPATSAVAPLAAPAAAPTVAQLSGGGFVPGTYVVGYSYLTDEGETSLSPLTTVTPTVNRDLQVTLGTLPSTARGANIYVGLEATQLHRSATLAASQTASPFTLSVPSALLLSKQPVPGPAIGVLPDPTVVPSVALVTGSTAFTAGTYRVGYTFFGVNGETALSPSSNVAVVAGNKITVTSGQALPPGALGMNVYVAAPNGSFFLTGRRFGSDLTPDKPVSLTVDSPAMFDTLAPGTTTAAGINPTVTPTSAPGSVLPAGSYYVRVATVDPKTGLETAISTSTQITLTDNQGIAVTYPSSPPSQVRVYANASSSNISSMQFLGTLTQFPGVETGREVHLPPGANQTTLAAPLTEAVTLSTLPAGSYQLAYTWTGPAGESTASPLASGQLSQAGLGLSVVADALPAGVTGMNVYLGMNGNTPQLVRGAAQPSVTVTSLPPSDAPFLPNGTAAQGAPSAPIAPPAVAVPSALATGTYKVQYLLGMPAGSVGTSPFAIQTISAGQALFIGLPVLPGGSRTAEVRVQAPSGGSYTVASGLGGLQRTLVTSLPGSQASAPVPVSGQSPTVQVVTTTGTGSLWASYAYVGASGETFPRSTETQAAGSSSTLTITTPATPSGASRVRLFLGTVANSPVQVADLPVVPGQVASYTAQRLPSASLTVYAVTTAWRENEANWGKATSSQTWDRLGGDYDRSNAVAALSGGELLQADMTSLVRQWASGQRPNLGIAIQGKGQPTMFASSENADINRRPALVVHYREEADFPSVQLSAPGPDAMITGPVQLGASAQPGRLGRPVTQVEFYADETLIGRVVDSPYTMVWNPIGLPPGKHKLSARAYDDVGQVGRSDWQTVFADSFHSLEQVETGLSTAGVDLDAGLVTLAHPASAIRPRSVSASSTAPYATHSVAAMLDQDATTFWRSEGVESASDVVSIVFEGDWIYVYPKNTKAGVLAKVQALGADGQVLNNGTDWQVLNANSSEFWVSSGTRGRLLLTNLPQDPVTGLHHAELTKIERSVRTGAAPFSVLEAKTYAGNSVPENATDGNAQTAWVSDAQSSAAASVTFDVEFMEAVSALSLTPHTPGVQAQIFGYDDAVRDYVPFATIPSLTEGLYSFGQERTAQKLRLVFTNLLPSSEAGQVASYYAGLKEISGYQAAAGSKQGVLTSKTVTLPTPASVLRLQTKDSVPAGTSIAYTVSDSVHSIPIQPGVPLQLAQSFGQVTLQATLQTSDPTISPSIASWQLESQGGTPIELGVISDTTPPSVQVVLPPAQVLSGTVEVGVNAADNLGVQRVELYADGDETRVLDSAISPPYTVHLDTSLLSPGPHLVWAKAVDITGNWATSKPAPSTISALTDTFDTGTQVDWDRTIQGVWDSSSRALILAAGTAVTTPFSGSGAISQTVIAGPGPVQSTVQNASCSATTIGLSRYSNAMWQSQMSEIQDPGECRDYNAVYLNGYSSSQLKLSLTRDAAAGSYTGAMTYFQPLGASADYSRTGWVVTKPVRPGGLITQVRVMATTVQPVGTSVTLYASADNGAHWQTVLPNMLTSLTWAGFDLRLMAELHGAAGSGSTYANLTPQLSDWSAEVTQFGGPSLVTTSQVGVPTNVAAAKLSQGVDLTWKPSTSPNVTYTVLRSASGFVGSDDEVAAKRVPSSGLATETAHDSTNLLTNSSFESIGAGGAPLNWTMTGTGVWSVDSTLAWIGDSALKLTDVTALASQTISTFPVGTALEPGTVFTVAGWFKGSALSEKNSQALGIQLTYTDSTSSTLTWAGGPAGTFDWSKVSTSVTAQKQVKSILIKAGMNGSGTLWVDGLQLDTKGAPYWTIGNFDSKKLYSYRVVAVDANGQESAPSAVVTAGTQSANLQGLGLKSFWNYLHLPASGGEAYVNVGNGNLVYTGTDLVYPGPLLVTAFRRTYNSAGSAINGSLGYGWTDNFQWRLDVTSTAVTLLEGDGASFVFTPGAQSGQFVAPLQARMRLVQQPDDSYSLVRYDTNLAYIFDNLGRLTEIREPNSNALRPVYGEKRQLVSATDPGTLLGLGTGVVGVADSTGALVRFGYNPAGLLETVWHPGYGVAVQFAYNADGELTAVTDLQGQTVRYQYGPGHILTDVVDADNHMTAFTYGETPGSVSTATLADGAIYRLGYGAVDSQTGLSTTTVTDPRSNTFTYGVDGNGLVRKQTFPSAAGTVTVQLDYDERWLVTKYTDPNNHATQIGRDGFGNVISVTDPAGKSTRSVWDERNYPGLPGQSLIVPAQQIDTLGQATTFDVDDHGNVTGITDPLVQTGRFTYATNGLLQTKMDPRGNQTTYVYQTNGQLLKAIDPEGVTISYTYDVGGNAATVTDGSGNTTRLTYDRLGRQTQVAAPDQGLTSFEYSPSGLLQQTVDATGGLVSYEYDALGRVLATNLYPDPAQLETRVTTRYEYDLAGNVTALVDPRQGRTTWAYDGAGRMLSQTDPLSRTRQFTYDAAGNMTKATGAGPTVQAEYDVRNLPVVKKVLLSSVSPATYLIYAYEYDSAGRPLTSTDPLGNKSSYQYDALGRLAGVTDAMGFTTRYQFDGAGNRTAVTDAQRRTTYFEYDKANRLVLETQPDGSAKRTRYDQAGRVTATINARGEEITYQYDPLNRVKQMAYPEGRSVRYEYDLLGQRTSMTDWTGTTRYEYDRLSHLTAVEDPRGDRVTYGYDDAGNRTQMGLSTPSAQLQWQYTYDAANQLTELLAPGQTTSEKFTYGTDGLLTNLTYASGAKVTQTYDLAGRLTGISSMNGTTEIMKASYTLDSVGNRTKATQSVQTVATNAYYQYDPTYRLTQSGATSSSADTEYYYDLVGNRHTSVDNRTATKGTTTYVTDEANRLTDQFGPKPSSQGGGRYHDSYYFDADGNLVRMEKDQKDVTLYSYDAANRLLQVTPTAGLPTVYGYNGDGQRVRLQDSTGTTSFIYDGAEVLAEVSDSGQLSVAYTRMPSGRLISQLRSGKTYWYHLDGLGSTIALTDGTNRVVNQYAYDEWGNQGSSTESVFNRYTFTGQAWDASSGLYNYKARYYNPQIGRFLTQDTYRGSAWEPWTQHLYAYVGNNPVNYIDPTGHKWDAEGGGGGAGGWIWPLLEWIGSDGPDVVEAAVDCADALYYGSPEGQLVCAVDVVNLTAPGQQSVNDGPTSSHPSSKPDIAGNVTRLPNEETIPPTKPGNAPTSAVDGRPIEIHHEGESPDGPFVEMHASEHRDGENYSANHSNTGQSPSNIDRTAWDSARRSYWRGESSRGRWSDSPSEF